MPNLLLPARIYGRGERHGKKNQLVAVYVIQYVSTNIVNEGIADRIVVVYFEKYG